MDEMCSCSSLSVLNSLVGAQLKHLKRFAPGAVLVLPGGSLEVDAVLFAGMMS